MPTAPCENGYATASTSFINDADLGEGPRTRAHVSLSGVQAVASPAGQPGSPRAGDGDDDTLNWYLSDVWQTEEGLPQNAIQAITQTRDGYLWVGTPVGLVRFDGVRFTVFKEGQLQNSNIHALLEAIGPDA